MNTSTPSTHTATHTATPIATRLSINVNKVAQLRNTRHIGIPSVTRAATLCLQAGAHGITVHPRPDQRHIRPHDVHELAELMQAWPQCEYNIEGNPTQNLMDFIRTVRPHQATFVPDSEDQFTSDHGWDLSDAATCQRLRPLIDECHALGVRVSLFMDAETAPMPQARTLGADRIELYTEPYAAAWGTPQQTHQLQRFAAAAQAALDCGLQVNAGHDLNRNNLTEFLRTVPNVAEVSIGHAFMADALELGYSATVQDYLRCMAQAAGQCEGGGGCGGRNAEDAEVTQRTQKNTKNGFGFSLVGCGDLSPTRGNALWLCAMLNVGANAEGAEVTQMAQKNTKNGFGLG